MISDVGAAPDPARAHDLAGLAQELDLLRRRAALGTRRAKIGLDELARRLGMPRSTVHVYVSGRRLPPADVLDQLVIGLGARPEELRGWADAWFRVWGSVVNPERGSGSSPAQLPPAPAPFVGRARQLAELDQLRDEPGLVIATIDGMPGVGKTSLALHWAHRVASRFPDGQLFANLRGYGALDPMDPAQVIEHFLASLEVPPARVPPDLDARSALLRTELAGRRVIMLLDNARSAEQVRPLLPAQPGCLVIVTSRTRLTGLAVRDGARRIGIEHLEPAGSIELLSHIVGDRRLRDEQPAAAEIARRCAGLPLALAVVGHRAAADPAMRLADLADELRDSRSRLDLMDAGDRDSSVRSVCSWSLAALEPGAARLFRLLGLHPGPNVDTNAAAALCAVPAAVARSALRALADAHLVTAGPSGRWSMHDLLRAFAAERAADEADSAEALRRLVVHYTDGAAGASAKIGFDEFSYRPAVRPDPRPATFADASTASGWLGAESQNLVSVALYCARHGLYGYARDLATALWRHLMVTAEHEAAVGLHRELLAAASTRADRLGESLAANDLGLVYTRVGRYEEALPQLRRAVTLAAEVPDPDALSRALNNLAVLCERQGKYEDAVRCHERGLAVAGQTGNRASQAAHLNNLGFVLVRLGRLERAGACHQLALDLFHELRVHHGQMNALDNLAVVSRLRGAFVDALRYGRQALRIATDHDLREGQCDVLLNLAATYHELGRIERARAVQRVVVVLARELGLRPLELSALRALLETERAPR